MYLKIQCIPLLNVSQNETSKLNMPQNQMCSKIKCIHKPNVSQNKCVPKRNESNNLMCSKKQTCSIIHCVPQSNVYQMYPNIKYIKELEPFKKLKKIYTTTPLDKNNAQKQQQIPGPSGSSLCQIFLGRVTF